MSSKFEEEVKLLTFEYGHAERLEKKEIDFMDFDYDSSFRDLCKRVSRNEEELKNLVMQNT